MSFQAISLIEQVAIHPEEGYPINGHVFYVVHTDKNGERLISPPIARRYTEPLRCDECAVARRIARNTFGLQDSQLELFALATIAYDLGFVTESHLLEQLANDQGPIDTSGWHRFWPVYGSPAYEKGQADDADAERQAELEAA
ncbi:MAG: hypothetical protein DWQ19_12775 [Crenarchaeota archaeon]|nr:MAG: hypothetical protein DWQ19_12775 [Thermoproteota archaeon]